MTDQNMLSGAVLGWWLTFAVHSIAMLLAAVVVQWSCRRLRPLWRDAIWKLALVIPLLSATWLTAGGVHPGWHWHTALALPGRSAAGGTPRPFHESGTRMPLLRASTDESTGRVGSSGAARSSAGTGGDPFTVPHETDGMVTEVLFPIGLTDLEQYDPTLQQPAEPSEVGSPRSDVSEPERPAVIPPVVEAARATDDTRLKLDDAATDAPSMRTTSGGQLAVWSLLVCWTWGLTRCGVARLRLHGLIRTACADRELDLVLTDVRSKLGYRGRLRLLVSERVSEPMACGVLRPTVLLPTSLLLQLDRGQLEEVLAHELSHLIRRDLMWLGLFRFVRLLVPGHWLAGWATRRWRENAELLCDDWMLHHGCSRTVLAAALVMVSEWKLNRGAGTPAGCVTFASRTSAVSRRVMRLLDGAQPGPAKWTWCQQICWLVVVAAGPLVVCRCLPAASFRQPEQVQQGRVQAERTSLRTVATGIQVKQESDRNVAHDSHARSWAQVELELRELQSELEVVESLLVQLDDPSALQLAGNLEDRAKQLRGRLEQLKSSRQRGRSHGDNLAHVRADSRGDE